MMEIDRDLIDPKTGSHPAIRFESIPPVDGPLTGFNQVRPQILREAVGNSVLDLQGADQNLLLGEALYQETRRLQHFKVWNPAKVFQIPRYRRDQALWGQVRSDLKRRGTDSDRDKILQKVLQHYAQEIGGHFSPSVYRLATKLTPWGFSWMLNAASVKRFLPWGMTESLSDRIRVLGEVPQMQRLAKEGTVLLVPTHQSNIDSVLIGYVIYLMSLPPFSYGAGLNLFSNPVLSFFMSNLGSYTVDRLKSNQIYKTILKNYSGQILQEGVHSVFYPGGGRSRTGAIETHLKLGLLGTGLRAQIELLKKNHPRPNVYIVPMVTSYEFVLEASKLIEGYLSGLGRHLFLGADTEDVPPFFGAMKWFWNLFSSRSQITVRIGRPLDVFGNFVDENGVSIGPNGTAIDPKKWLTTNGELRPEPQRDIEYTRQLGNSIVDRYYAENTVLSAHLLAFTYFIALRKHYPSLDLFRFLRLTQAQRSIGYEDFLKDARLIHEKVKKAADRGQFFISEELRTSNVEEWVRHGSRNLGLLHDHEVIRIKDGTIWTDDLNLVYYYRNRLSGYGLSLLGEQGRVKLLRGELDEQGFLA